MQGFPSLLAFSIVALLGTPPPAVAQSAGAKMFEVAARDGIAIAVECAGSGPTLLLVHGGIGDRTRWTPMFPLLSARFTVCAMDRRGHGESGDSPLYSLEKESQDIVDVVEALDDPVSVLGHSYGGVAALEAALDRSAKVQRLILYEPPVTDPSDPAMIDKIERLVAADQREEAALTFWREVVKYSPEELEAMQKRPNWPKLVADFDAHPRQMRALAGYRFDPDRARSLSAPTLLLLGSETKSAALKRAIEVLDSSIPDSTLVVLEGQEHNAMDRDREQLARAIETWLLAK